MTEGGSPALPPLTPIGPRLKGAVHFPRARRRANQIRARGAGRGERTRAASKALLLPHANGVDWGWGPNQRVSKADGGSFQH